MSVFKRVFMALENDSLTQIYFINSKTLLTLCGERGPGIKQLLVHVSSISCCKHGDSL
jgi:hypothetical protein